jgi:hypothetical protein
MANLNDILAGAQGGQATAALGREFGLTPGQTQAAVTALLPAISTGLKRATATPEGLANLLAAMAQQDDLPAMYDDPRTAFAQQGRGAGNDLLSVIFGSPEVSRAVADRAQAASGIGSTILKKLLPVLVGMLISGMLGRKSSKAAPAELPPPPETTATPAGGGDLWEILQQAFRRSLSQQSDASPPPAQIPAPGGQPLPIPGGPFPRAGEAGEAPFPSGDLLGQLLRELGKAIQEGRVKPVVVEMPFPGGQIPSAPGEDAPNPRRSGTPTPNDEILPGPKMPAGGQPSGGDILGNILRELLGGASAPGSRLTQASGFGSAVFGDRFEAGPDVDPKDVDDIERLLDQFSGGRRG